MTDIQAVKNFYDDSIKSCLNNYIYGNWRVDATEDLVVSQIPQTACRLLEIGCGMGAVTSMIVARRPQCKIVALDISPKRIEYAGKLCSHPNIEYIASDVEAFAKCENGGARSLGRLTSLSCLM